MTTAELINLLEDELKYFGNKEIVTFCPRHSGEDGPPVPVVSLAWYGDVERSISATWLECVECHHEGIADKCEADAMADIEAGV